MMASCDAGEEAAPDKPRSYDFVVAADGSGDFTSVQAAFDAVKFNQGERTYIYVKNGEYKEVLTLEKNKDNITLIGESKDGVLLTFDNYASKVNPATGEEYGTSGSSSTYIYGDGFYARDITFENSSGPVGQALAVYLGGDRAIFEDCRFLGNQDTVYGGRCRQYFVGCYIEGTTDFIFGPSTAYFESCELYTRGGSAITAASTESYVAFGYIFNHCKISGSGDNITTLGRPWRPFAAVTFMNTEMGGCIKPAGWDNWGDPANEETVRYKEYQNTGPGASTVSRVDWTNYLTPTEATSYTPEKIFKTTYTDPPADDHWVPASTIEEVAQFLTDTSND